MTNFKKSWHRLCNLSLMCCNCFCVRIHITRKSTYITFLLLRYRSILVVVIGAWTVWKQHIILFSVSFKIETLGYKHVFLNSPNPYSEISIQKQYFGWGARRKQTRAICRVESQVPVAEKCQKLGECALQSIQRKSDNEMNKMNSWGELEEDNRWSSGRAQPCQKVNF